MYSGALDNTPLSVSPPHHFVRDNKSYHLLTFKLHFITEWFRKPLITRFRNDRAGKGTRAWLAAMFWRERNIWSAITWSAIVVVAPKLESCPPRRLRPGLFMGFRPHLSPALSFGNWCQYMVWVGEKSFGRENRFFVAFLKSCEQNIALFL